MRSPWVLARAVIATAVLFAGGVGVAAATPVPTVVSPTAGTALELTPPAGFANLDHPLQWTITYDCPGPASIHSSYAERRPAGAADWQGQLRDGPFLGDGSFSTPSTFFPVAQPAQWEWRVFWACGATEGFAGSQGTSAPVSFTVALPVAATPPAAPATPATAATPAAPAAPVTTPAPCAGRTGSARVVCRSSLRRARALRACAKRKHAKARAACRRRANALHRRTVRLQTCHKLKGKRRAACTRRANLTYRRAVTPRR